jgi:hypothetical protein
MVSLPLLFFALASSFFGSTSAQTVIVTLGHTISLGSSMAINIDGTRLTSGTTATIGSIPVFISKSDLIVGSTSLPILPSHTLSPGSPSKNTDTPEPPVITAPHSTPKSEKKHFIDYFSHRLTNSSSSSSSTAQESASRTARSASTSSKLPRNHLQTQLQSLQALTQPQPRAPPRPTAPKRSAHAQQSTSPPNIPIIRQSAPKSLQIALKPAQAIFAAIHPSPWLQCKRMAYACCSLPHSMRKLQALRRVGCNRFLTRARQANHPNRRSWSSQPRPLKRVKWSLRSRQHPTSTRRLAIRRAMC